jgi:hypothetical protein
MDISLALLPWRVLWKLQMRLAEKIGVGIAMSLGVLQVQSLLEPLCQLQGKVTDARCVKEQEPPPSSEADMSSN